MKAKPNHKQFLNVAVCNIGEKLVGEGVNNDVYDGVRVDLVESESLGPLYITGCHILTSGGQLRRRATPSGNVPRTMSCTALATATPAA